ncbi:MAG: GPR endopeptidase [Lachnospiraceae bacterium]|nr:GPR endopeptidase [Lachnospiraceae bacterium]
MKRYIRTDLALELKEDLPEQGLIDGVKIFTKNYKDEDIKETIIEVVNKNGEMLLGKPVGTYVTIESKSLREGDDSINKSFMQILHHNLAKMIGKADKIMVIGLGNRAITPDSLGPLVIDNLYITRHLINEGLVKEDKELSALAPGVMAQTGIETSVIIKSVCDKVKPDVVIAIDALAAREPDRLNSTIQICDTGINPGAGVGNNRAKLDKKTLGVKVIAIGVPTVISVPAIVYQSVEGMVNVLRGEVGKSSETKDNKKNKSKEYNGRNIKNNDKTNDTDEEKNRVTDDEDRLDRFTDAEKYEIACNLLEPDLAAMFVTPKNIDEAVKRVSYTISEAINGFLNYKRN